METDKIQIMEPSEQPQAAFPITLRPMEERDIETFAPLAASLFEDAYRDKMPYTDLLDYTRHAFSISRVRLEWEDPDALFILACWQGELVGYTKLNSGRGRDLEDKITGAPGSILIERMYVLKGYQSRKVGRTLMQYCLRYAKDKAFPRVWLNVWEQNPDAIRFYRQWGFEIFDTRIVLRGNDPQKAILMERFTQNTD